jgi:integrase
VLKPDTYLTFSEIEALFCVIKSSRDKALFQLLRWHGLRSSEIGLLQRSDWNDRDGVLRVRRQKNSISQSYRLLAVEANALRAWLRDRGNEPGALFPSQKGVRPGGFGISRAQVFRLMQRYSEMANLNPAKAHPRALRHACGVYLRSAGAEVIRERLGHRAEKSALVYFPRRRAR